MTLQEKIDRYMAHMRVQQVGDWAAAPPLTRLLWKLHIDVPPPFYWTFASKALLYGTYFAACLFCLHVWRSGTPSPGQVFGTLIAGAFYGLSMAAFSRSSARRVQLLPWDPGVEAPTMRNP